MFVHSCGWVHNVLLVLHVVELLVLLGEAVLHVSLAVVLLLLRLHLLHGLLDAQSHSVLFYLCQQVLLQLVLVILLKEARPHALVHLLHH